MIQRRNFICSLLAGLPFVGGLLKAKAEAAPRLVYVGATETEQFLQSDGSLNVVSIGILIPADKYKRRGARYPGWKVEAMVECRWEQIPQELLFANLDHGIVAFRASDTGIGHPFRQWRRATDWRLTWTYYKPSGGLVEELAAKSKRRTKLVSYFYGSNPYAMKVGAK
jgi:hypothetical protein